MGLSPLKTPQPQQQPQGMPGQPQPSPIQNNGLQLQQVNQQAMTR